MSVDVLPVSGGLTANKGQKQWVKKGVGKRKRVFPHQCARNRFPTPDLSSCSSLLFVRSQVVPCAVDLAFSRAVAFERFSQYRTHLKGSGILLRGEA